MNDVAAGGKLQIQKQSFYLHDSFKKRTVLF